MKFKNFVCIFFIFSFYSSLAWSAKIKKVKGTSVLIDSETSNIKKNGLYYLVFKGKKKAIIRVLKVRPGMAIGKILKGRAAPGWKLVKRPSKKKSSVAKRTSKTPLPPLKNTSTSKKKRSSSDSFSSRMGVGGVVSFGQDSSSVDFSTGSQSFSGSSTSFEIIADYKYTNKISFRGSLGQQAFFTEDTGQICDGEVCRIDLSYINLDLWGKYHFTPKYWAGAGIGILLSPSFGDTTAIQEDGLSTTSFIQVGAGADFNVSKKLYVPVWAEFGTFLQSGDASINSISIKAGLAMKL